MDTILHAAGASRKIQRCIVHIGTEKTGTSSIQHFLANNYAALANEGVVYPRTITPAIGSQWDFVATVMDRPWRSNIGANLRIANETDAKRHREWLISTVDEELARYPEADTLLISSEHFHSRLKSPKVILRLKDFLRRWTDEFRIIVYFRRQDRVAVSRYSTQLKSGSVNPDVFPSNDKETLPYYYDYRQIYKNWVDVFGASAMVAGLFEREELIAGDLIDDFCQKAGLNPDGKQRPLKINMSLGNYGVELLHEFNKQWPRQVGSLQDRDRQRLVQQISKSYHGKSYPISRRQAQRFYARFDESNRQLAAQAFPDRQRPLFPDDFDAYPIQVLANKHKVARKVSRMMKEYDGSSVSLSKKIRRALCVDIPSLLSLRPRAKRQLPPLFLHVGLPKTATSTLRNTFFRRHTEIYCLNGCAGFYHIRGCCSEPLYQALAPLFWDRAAYPGAPRLRKQLLAQLGQVGDKVLLASWETLGNSRNAEFESMLLDSAAVFGDLRLIFTLRNPLTRMPSLYLQALKICGAGTEQHPSVPKGRLYLPFEDWLYRVAPDGHDYRFAFGDNLKCAVRHLGVERVGVFLFEDLLEDPEGFFQGMAEFLGIDPDEARKQESEHWNPALTAGQVAFLQRMDASASERGQWLALPREEREARLGRLRDEGGGEKYRVQLDDGQKDYIVRRSQAVHRWIAATFQLDLRRHGYPL
jgi:hypothetical protein